MNEECQIVVVIPIALVTGSLHFSVEVLACIMELNACQDISICSFLFICSICLLMMGSECM